MLWPPQRPTRDKPAPACTWCTLLWKTPGGDTAFVWQCFLCPFPSCLSRRGALSPSTRAVTQRSTRRSGLFSSRIGPCLCTHPFKQSVSAACLNSALILLCPMSQLPHWRARLGQRQGDPNQRDRFPYRLPGARALPDDQYPLQYFELAVSWAVLVV